MAGDRGTDRRIERTKRLLHGALGSLIHQKSYDDIVVKEILARANVGRSTFYTHFRDKDELLESGIRDVLRAAERGALPPSASAAERVLAFSLPILEHVARHREMSDASMEVMMRGGLHERLERVLGELIADDLRRLSGPAVPARAMPLDLLARHVAATFVRVLDWWAACESPPSAREANDVFRALVLPAVCGAVSA